MPSTPSRRQADLRRTTSASAPRSLAVLALWAASYLAGSIPIVYFLGRRQNVDLRRSGSGTVGGSNLWASGGIAPAAIGWIADALKGLLPIASARRLGIPRGPAGVAGVFGLAGQCWPLFLGFRGGRGISSFVGAALIIDPFAWMVSMAAMAAGSLARVIPMIRRSRPRDLARPAGLGEEDVRARLRSQRSRLVPLATLAGVLLFPVVCAARRRTRLAAPLLLSATVIVRRLTAARLDDADNGPATRPIALWYRLLYDRNTPD